MDSNLFKEAIADAKAVRQTALANAKVALEEAFTERYKAMFAEKLKEEAEQEPTMPAEEGGMNSTGNASEQEVDELIKELEAEVSEDPVPEPGAEEGDVPPPPAGAGAPPPMGGAPMGGAPMGGAPMGEPPMGGAPMGGAPMGEPPMGGAPTMCPPG